MTTPQQSAARPPAAPAGGWQPANEVERLLTVALLEDDPEQYLVVLVNAPLYLPGFADPDRLLYTDHEGERHLVAYTSVEELYANAGELVEGWRGTSLVELVRAWPDPSWGLAVDPAAPIGVFISARRLADLPLPDEPPLSPRDETERLLHHALLIEDLPGMLAVLVAARVGVAVDDRAGYDADWRVEDVDGVPAVVVFTADRHPGPAATVDFVTVLRRWPPDARQLAVNPGTSLGVRFPRERVDDLLRFAEARARAATEPTPPADAAVPAEPSVPPVDAAVPAEPSVPPADPAVPASSATSSDAAPPSDRRATRDRRDAPLPGQREAATPEATVISDILRGGR